MLEDIELFKCVMNEKALSTAPIMLVLNFYDEFEELINKGVGLELAFPEYDGAADVASCLEYVRNQLLQHAFGAQDRVRVKVRSFGTRETRKKRRNAICLP